MRKEKPVSTSETFHEDGTYCHYEDLILGLLIIFTVLKNIYAHRLRPIPIASVATRILQGSSGSLNFLAWDSLVPVIHRTVGLSLFLTQKAEMIA